MQSAVLCPRKQSRLRQWCWKGLWACAGGLLPEKPSSTANSGTKGFRALPTRQTEPEHLPKTGLLQGKVNIAPPRILSLEWLYQKARNTTTALRMVAGKERTVWAPWWHCWVLVQALETHLQTSCYVNWLKVLTAWSTINQLCYHL